MMDNSTEQAVLDALQEWMQKKRVPPNDAVTQLLTAKVVSYISEGEVPAPAHFERAYVLLVRDGQIKPFSGPLGSESTTAPAAVQADVPLTAEAYHRMSANEVIRRY